MPPRFIFDSTAPREPGEFKVALYMPYDVVPQLRIAHIARNIETRIINALQLSEGGQTPSCASQSQIGAVGFGLLPVHFNTVVSFGPSESGGWVGPN